MSIDLEPFMQRVRAYPDDDAPRLILADWLEEQGGEFVARAEFIRVQIALAGLNQEDPRRRDLLLTERSLLDRHRDEWEAPLRRLATGLVFRRGFIEELNVDARDFVRHAHELFAAGPIRHLHLLNLGSHLPEVLASSFLGRLRALTIFAQYAGEPLGQALAGAGNLVGLRALHLQRNRLGDSGVRHLVGSAVLTSLEELNLAENDLTDGAALALSTSAHLGRLRRLELRDNAIGPAGARALAAAETLVSLEQLGIARNDVGSMRGHSTRLAGGMLRFLTLDLAGNGLGAESLKAILSPSRLQILAASEPDQARSNAARIRELDLSQNEIGEAGARVLAESPMLKNLHVLRLSACGITDAAARILADSRQLEHLESLEIGNNPVGDRGLGAFLHTGLRRLRRLVIPSFGVSQLMQQSLAERFPGGIVRH